MYYFVLDLLLAVAWSAVFLLLFLVGLLDECFDEWLDDRELRPVELLDDLEPELLELLLELKVEIEKILVQILGYNL